MDLENITNEELITAIAGVIIVFLLWVYSGRFIRSMVVVAIVLLVLGYSIFEIIPKE